MGQSIGLKIREMARCLAGATKAPEDQGSDAQEEKVNILHMSNVGFDFKLEEMRGNTHTVRLG